MKNTVAEVLDRPSRRWMLGFARTVVANARGERVWITYDRSIGGWSKRTRGGIMLMDDPIEMNAEQCDAFARDVFLLDYALKPGDVVLDVGAGFGTEALPFSKMVGDSGRVIAVEAFPSTFRILQRVCELNDLRNVTLVHAAVMDTNEPVTMSDVGADSYLENKIGAGGVEVRAVTIPDLIAQLKLDRVDFLKMNIEGAEAPALLGAKEVLGIVRHAAIGCHDFLADEKGDDSYRTKETVRALLEDAGFTIKVRDEDPRPWAAHYLYASR